MDAPLNRRSVYFLGHFLAHFVVFYYFCNIIFNRYETESINAPFGRYGSHAGRLWRKEEE